MRFHFIVKRKYKSRFGKPDLCDIVDHPYHDSKFEKATCQILQKYFPPGFILTPSQHKFSTKFDFLVKDIAIVEPHGVWNGLDYFSYYKNRRNLAEKVGLFLPIIIIPNYIDLTFLENILKNSANIIYDLKTFQVQMLNKYSHSCYDQKIENNEGIRTNNFLWKQMALLGWVVSVIQFLFFTIL